ncbi:hypothetical protein SDC9_205441 [bioreactor metagenome]|uniref:Uncharacterized protein n=1 Tax=bioreactor metagenome TaxID=1076179 RepID=A0A645J2X0_9ZZZZ
MLADEENVVLKQGGINLLPTPGNATLHQRRHGANRAEHASHDVVHARPRAQRIAGAASHVGQTAHHLHHFIKRRTVLVGTRQETRMVDINEAGVVLAERGIVQPELGQRPGLKVLQHHIGRQR